MTRIVRQQKLIVIAIAIILVLTVGYALFNKSLDIGGTASATGKTITITK